MRARVGWVLLCVGVLACSRSRTEGTAATGETSTTGAPTHDAAPSPSATASSRIEDGVAPVAALSDPRFVDAAPKGGRSLGHTSVVFKVELANGAKAVFKPSTRRGPRRYKGEIAAYRLGVALGLGANVPKAYFRTFEAQALGNVLAAPALELHEKESIVEGGRVKGAIMPWIDDLDFVDLEKEPLLSAWKGWLKKGGVIPEEKKRMAAEIAAMICFDWLGANWDRWSGGNVGTSKSGGQLLFVDNDGAFFEVPPKDGLERTKKLLLAIDRFPRALVEKIRALDEAKLAEIVGEESKFVPLLSPKAFAGVIERKRELVAMIDAKTADGGDDPLFFP